MWDNWGEQSLLYSFLQEKSEKLVREDAQLLDVEVILSLYIFFFFNPGFYCFSSAYTKETLDCSLI